MTSEAEPATRDALILASLPYAKYLAWATVKRVPRWVALDDAVQEASLGVIEGLDRWNPGRLVYREKRKGVFLREYLKPGIIGRVLNLARRREGREARIAYQRKAKDSVELLDSRPTPEELVSRKETQRAVQAALSRLPARQQRMIRWRYWDELTHVEIGRLDGGVTEQRVTLLHTAALRRLRRSPELARLRRTKVS